MLKSNAIYILYIYVSNNTTHEAHKTMALSPYNGIDKKLAKLYAEKVTVNLDNKSTLDPEDFWKTMQMIAVTNKAMMHLR